MKTINFTLSQSKMVITKFYLNNFKQITDFERTKKKFTLVTSFYFNNSMRNSNETSDTNQNMNSKWFLCVLLSLIIFLTAFGNFLVFVSVYRERKLQTSTNLFLISLAIADFMVALFVMPSSLIVEILDYYPFDWFICTIWICFDVLCCTSSIYHMSTMAVDRYLTIKFPLKFGRNKSKRIALIKISFVWLVSLIVCSPILIISFKNKANVFDSSKLTCQLFNKEYRLYGSIIAFFIPFIIMLVAYISSIKILKKVLDKKLDDKKQKLEESLRNFQKQKFSNMLEGLFMQTTIQLNLESQEVNNPLNINLLTRTSSFSTSGNRSRYSFVNYQSIKNVAQNEKKALKVLIIIFTVFVSLWCPFFILNTISAVCDDCIKRILSEYNESFVYSFLTWMGYISSMANPIVYTMFNKSFRTAFINILKCKKVDQTNNLSFKKSFLNQDKNLNQEEKTKTDKSLSMSKLKKNLS